MCEYEINFKTSIGPSRERNCRKDESEYIDLFFVLYNTIQSHKLAFRLKKRPLRKVREYRVAHLVSDLDLVDSDFDCSTHCLGWLIQNLQNWLSKQP